MEKIKVSDIQPLRDRVYVTEMEFGMVKTKSGIITRDDDGKLDGIRPRWGRVVIIGPDQKEIEIGDYVLLKHGRWTRAIPAIDQDNKDCKVYMVDYPDAVLIVSKERPAKLDQIFNNYSGN